MMSLLEVKELTKHFDLSGDLLGRLFWGEKTLKAVDYVNFSIDEGQTLGLVGESGCGKSTTARLITRLIPATGGQVYFQGKEILSLPQSQGQRDPEGHSNGFSGPLRLSQSAHDGAADRGPSHDALLWDQRANGESIRRPSSWSWSGCRADSLYRYPHEFAAASASGSASRAPSLRARS